MAPTDSRGLTGRWRTPVRVHHDYPGNLRSAPSVGRYDQPGVQTPGDSGTTPDRGRIGPFINHRRSHLSPRKEHTMPLDDILRDVSVDNAWRHIEHITEHIPSRLAGSPNSRRMSEYATETLSAAGLDSQMHDFLGLVSFPEPATVRLLSPEHWEAEANTLGHSASTEGIEGEL